jgi:hypothetical protein
LRYGTYNRYAVLAFVGTFLLLILSFWQRPAPIRLSLQRLGAWAVLGCSVLLAIRPLVLYVEEPMALIAIKAAQWLAIIPAWLLALSQTNWPFARVLRQVPYLVLGSITLFIALHLITRVAVLIAVPHPPIDVHVWVSEAADYFLAGINPYGRPYTDINACLPNGPGYPPVFNYLPGVLLWATPFQGLLGEIRVGFLFADLITVGCLYLFGRQQNLTPLTSAVLPMLWLSFPVQLYVLQQAWVDTLLISGVALFLVLMGYRRYVLAGIVLGGVLLTKQYAFPIVLVTFVWLWSRGLRREAWRVTLLSGAVFALGMLPFFLANPSVFYYSVVRSLADQAFRADGFTLAALLKAKGIAIPGSVYGLICLGTLGVVLGRLWISPALTWGGWAKALIICYGVAFLLAKQAFCNYYQFFAFFVLIYLATQLTPVRGESAVSVSDGNRS